jgi:hypothetical protein
VIDVISPLVTTLFWPDKPTARNGKMRMCGKPILIIIAATSSNTLIGPDFPLHDTASGQKLSHPLLGFQKPIVGEIA